MIRKHVAPTKVLNPAKTVGRQKMKDDERRAPAMGEPARKADDDVSANRQRKDLLTE